MNKSQKQKSHSPKTQRQFAVRPRLSTFARRVLRELRALQLPLAESTFVVAVSGGADSVALLLALDELTKAKKVGARIVVAHLNHKLRGAASNADARWVQKLSDNLAQPFAVSAFDVKKRAARTRDNLEQAARRARYQFLKKTARAFRAEVVLTAHTADDQAETMMLNLLRGSGAEGLSGINPRRPISAGSEIFLARPLMSWARRADTEGYCRQRGIDFRLDKMNADESFARVRIRKQLLPLMQTYNPRLVETLVRTAEILREENRALDSAATTLLESWCDGEPADQKKRGSLRISAVQTTMPSLRRRALRLWIAKLRGNLNKLESAHIRSIENLMMSTKSGRVVELPEGSRVFRSGGFLHYLGRKPSRRP